MPKSHGRHTPAFLLLLLAEGPSYGALLLSRMKSELPFCLSDSAIVYRSLVQMEKEGLIDGRWVPEGGGKPRKWYSISAKGVKALGEYAEDIGQRMANLQFFLERYRSIGPGTGQ